ncbi:helix-turn-helix domain-containing protein [Sphaerotilus microaerophilus]|uniref:helix-turn-helix domain-containing protein n=1 Tax=Sphaerotilus microaerophilus TaxID=2914710 RepID=UPI00207492C5|nr:helix-turn-helix transcriptional regulator [Sphaerotilus sp. FB-5]
MPEPDVLRAFGQALKYHRQASSLSQEALAELCGLHRTYVGSIERGERNLGLLNIFAICDALCVSPEAIFRTTDLFLNQKGVRSDDSLRKDDPNTSQREV